jgi:hypothetical protein
MTDKETFVIPLAETLTIYMKNKLPHINGSMLKDTKLDGREGKTNVLQDSIPMGLVGVLEKYTLAN